MNNPNSRHGTGSEKSAASSADLRYILEGWKRAGLDWLPTAPDSSKLSGQPFQPEPDPTAADQDPPTAPAKLKRLVQPGHSESDASDRDPPKVQSEQSSKSLRVELPKPSTEENPEESLRILAERVSECTRCPALVKERNQTVFGVGDPRARIMFLGEAPGADEDRTGIPFVGAAGQLLDRIIAACHLQRDEIYICNVLRCRPPGNRNPTAEEAGNCREYLDGQIAIVQPEYIVCWGTVAAQNLLGCTTSIGRLRGRFHQFGSARVLCTYHPSYLLRNESAKPDVWADMKMLLRDMGVELS